MPINLPKAPDGYQFEEAVSATVRSIGYFTESRTILAYEGREILELDVVASPASELFLNRILIDAKKPTAGFADIFKIFGWRTFLKIPRGCIVHGEEMDPEASTALKEVCPQLNVHANHFVIGQPPQLDAIPVINAACDDDLRHHAASVGWYQQIGDRLALADFYKVRKLNRGCPLFERIRQYRYACHNAFFEADPCVRVKRLYTAFQEDPGITGACVKWQAQQIGKHEAEIWTAVRDTHNFPWIQYVMTIEARARVLIIKNGIEAVLQGSSASPLPRNFQVGIHALKKTLHFWKVPFVLQLYIELFGGFLVDDKDREQIARLACVPLEVVNESLSLFQAFFPMGKGWVTASKEVLWMKMIPGYWRGIGAFFRKQSRRLTSYTEIAPVMHFLIGQWHNAAYNLLEQELAIKSAE